jgi:hypothetical protein
VDAIFGRSALIPSANRNPVDLNASSRGTLQYTERFRQLNKDGVCAPTWEEFVARTYYPDCRIAENDYGRHLIVLTKVGLGAPRTPDSRQANRDTVMVM